MNDSYPKEDSLIEKSIATGVSAGSEPSSAKIEDSVSPSSCQELRISPDQAVGVGRSTTEASRAC